MISSRLRVLALLLPLLLLPGLAQAKQTVGTPFSSPVDGDGAAFYWNPAALSLIEGTQIFGGFNPALIYTGYTRTGIDGQTGMPFQPSKFNAFKPEIVAGFTLDRIHPRLRLGIGVSFPLVLGAQWGENQVTPQGQTILSPTRYYTTNATFLNVYFHLAASWKFNRYIAVGAGPNFVLSILKQTSHIDFATQAPGGCTAINLCENPVLSSPATVDAKGFGVGASVGILLTPTDWIRLGISYVSPVKQNLSATLTLDTSRVEQFIQMYLPTLKPLGLMGSGNAELTLPQQVNVALAVNVHPRMELMGGFQWSNLSSLSLIDIRLADRTSMLLPDAQTAATVRRDQFFAYARAIYQIHERWKLALRLEYINNTAPAEYTAPNAVDWDRIDIGLAAQLKVGRHTLVMGYAHVIGFTNTVTASAFGNDRPPPTFNRPDPTGTYTFMELRPTFSYAFTF